MRVWKILLSDLVLNAPSIVVKNDGQPVPLSYFIADVNTGQLQPAQTNTPRRFSPLSGLEPGARCPPRAAPRRPSGDRRLRHSSFVSTSGFGSVSTFASFAR